MLVLGKRYRNSSATDSMIVKSGTLSAKDNFVSRLSEGRVRHLKGYSAEIMHRYLPDQSVFLLGFKLEVEMSDVVHTVADRVYTRHSVKMREQRSASHPPTKPRSNKFRE